MGSLKDRSFENDNLLRIAEEVAVRVGLLGRCKECRATYDPLSWVYEDAYKLGNSLITRGDILVDGLGGDDRRRLTDALKDIGQHFPNVCSCGISGFRNGTSANPN